MPGLTYRQSTNSYKQANRNQYTVQQIPLYQLQHQQQQLTYLTVDCKPAILQSPAKLAKDPDIKPHVQQHNQPAAYHGQQEEHQHNNMYNPMTISKSSIMTMSTLTTLRSASQTTAKSASNHSRQTTPYTSTSNQHTKRQSSSKTQRKLNWPLCCTQIPKKKSS